MSTASATPKLGEETVPADEAAAVARVVQLIRTKYALDYASVRPALRDQHAKSHGCVRAQFIVGSDVPQELRHGIFAEPGSYEAWIRFSSSAARPTADSKRDAHGMSIKVMGVDGEKILPSERDARTQDFVIANNPVFFCRTAADYVLLAEQSALGKLPRFFLPSANPRTWRVREGLNLLIATQKKVVDPLAIRYWSQTPFALGPHAVKYSATPGVAGGGRQPHLKGRDLLQDAMARQLEHGEAMFDFMVQRQTDPRRMPVEDPTVRWKERRSPFRTVATIRIGAQDFTSQAHKNFAEALSFTPSHSLPDHRPLGGINRVRAAAYEAVSEMRHDMNRVARLEPSDGAP